MAESLLLLVRMLVSLAVLGGLGWFLLRLARQRGLGGLGARTVIDVESQRGLSRSASIAVVRVGTRHLLLGVGDHGVRVLAEGDDLVELPPEPTVAEPSADDPLGADAGDVRASGGGMALLERLRDATVRRVPT